MATETIHTTANHPWLTTDRGWVHAGDLRPGEPVVTLPGQTGSASSATTATVAWVRAVAGAAEMDNLTVAQDHTYVVGASRAVVHNTNAGCQPYPGDPLPEFTGDKTTGRFVQTDGSYRDLLSGYTDNNISLQPRRLLPDVVPGMEKPFGSWNHVEAHAASVMRLEGIQEADLWINNPSGPCTYEVGCQRYLPDMLPEGAILHVHYPGGSDGGWLQQTFVGRPDSSWIPWRPAR